MVSLRDRSNLGAAYLSSPLSRGVARSAGGLYRDIIAPAERNSVDNVQPPASFVGSPLERGHKSSRLPYFKYIPEGDTSIVNFQLSIHFSTEAVDCE